MNFWEHFILFFSCQALLLAIYLFIKKSSNKIANVIWGVFLLLFSFNLFLNVLFWSKFSGKLMLNFSLLPPYLLALYGPLFYLYLKGLVKPKKIGYKDFVHFVPFLIMWSYHLRYLTLSYDEKLAVYKNGLFHEYVLIPYMPRIFVPVILIYGICSYLVLKNAYLKDREMTIWLRLIMFFFLGFPASMLAYIILSYFKMLTIEYDYFLTILMIFFVWVTTFFGYVHPKIFNGKSIQKILPFIKYKNTGLSPALSQDLKSKLIRLMDEKRPYLNSEVRLNDIAEMMNVQRHHASQVINENFGMGFFDFINTYRIREAERLLNSSKTQISVTDIGFKSGFNNRVSFYKAFKKILGTTPTDYKNQNRAS